MGTYKWWCPKCGCLNRYMGDSKRICSCCKTDTSEMNVEVIFDNDNSKYVEQDIDVWKYSGVENDLW